MRADSVVVFETKPATEWILGAPVQKVSPRYAHGALQAKFASRLLSWAEGRGRVATEWRFWVRPPGEEVRYLVPDVAYLSFERVPIIDHDAAQEPRMAPDLAVEIVSPSDRPTHRLHKIDVYLRSGAGAVVEVDPLAKMVVVYDADDTRTLTVADDFAHPAVLGFVLPLRELFEGLAR